MFRYARFTLLALTISLAACGGDGSFSGFTSPDGNGQYGETPDPVPIDVTPPQPGIEDEVGSARWEAAGKDSRQWTVFAYKELEESGPELLTTVPEDVADFCPNYANLPKPKKKNFWVYLLSAISELESNFNPALTYTEDFNDGSGKKVISRGLLQLSIESALAYGCPLKNANDLHDPRANILCGIKILNQWVGRDKVIRGNANGWKGGARYWSVLRRQHQFDSIRAHTKLLPHCR